MMDLKFKLITFIISSFFLTLCIQITAVSAEPTSAEILSSELAQSSESVESADKEDIAELDSEETGPDNSSNQETKDTGTLMHVPSAPVQFCQGKYEKKGIGGVEIVTVKCPEVTNTCNCEVSEKSLQERVNCGGVIKNSTKGSNLMSCDSQIVGN
jgi:hypothetical protein